MKCIMGGIIVLTTIFILNIPVSPAFEFDGFADVSFSKGTKGAEPKAHDSSLENHLRRVKKTPPIHVYEDRRNFLVPLIFTALCEPSGS